MQNLSRYDVLYFRVLHFHVLCFQRPLRYTSCESPRLAGEEIGNDAGVFLPGTAVSHSSVRPATGDRGAAGRRARRQRDDVEGWTSPVDWERTLQTAPETRRVAP